jgi:hypothetical protein
MGMPYPAIFAIRDEKLLNVNFVYLYTNGKIYLNQSHDHDGFQHIKRPCGIIVCKSIVEHTERLAILLKSILRNIFIVMLDPEICIGQCKKTLGRDPAIDLRRNDNMIIFRKQIVPRKGGNKIIVRDGKSEYDVIGAASRVANGGTVDPFVFGRIRVFLVHVIVHDESQVTKTTTFQTRFGTLPACWLYEILI